MQYIGSLKAAEKHISAKIFKENLHTSVKILQICKDLQGSVQRSLQNPAENNPADLHRFAKIENLGTNWMLLVQLLIENNDVCSIVNSSNC